MTGEFSEERAESAPDQKDVISEPEPIQPTEANGPNMASTMDTSKGGLAGANDSSLKQASTQLSSGVCKNQTTEMMKAVNGYKTA